MERRKQNRIPLEVWVEETTREGDSYYERTSNLSSGGLFLDRAVPHRPGTIVTLTFTLPDADAPIRCKGRILDHHDPEGFGMAVEFVELSDDEQKRIDAFIAQQQQDGDETAGDATAEAAATAASSSENKGPAGN